jgi:hypothetical protein
MAHVVHKLRVMRNFTTLEIPMFETVNAGALAQVCGGCKRGKHPGKSSADAQAMTGQSSERSGDPQGMSQQSASSLSSSPSSSSMSSASPMSGSSTSVLAAPLASLSQAIQSVQQALGQMGGGAQQ